MSNILEYRAILEIVYFATGIFTFIGIIVAIIQLHKTNIQLGLTRKIIQVSNTDIELRSKRESISISLRECAILNERISNLYQYETEKGFKFYEGKIDGFQIENLNDEAKNWLDSNLNLYGVSDLLNEVENTLENFSSYFESYLGDKETAFKRVGEIYVIYFKFVYPFIASRRNENNIERRNIYSVNLYNDWNTKIELKELESKKNKIQNEMNQRILKAEISPLGTSMVD